MYEWPYIQKKKESDKLKEIIYKLKKNIDLSGEEAEKVNKILKENQENKQK